MATTKYVTLTAKRGRGEKISLKAANINYANCNAWLDGYTGASSACEFIH
ncbi:unnamed protein product [Paramecium sonneborni]|uniref:Uncharacterized protein n=1 Tax=Paramecium sonneborni TaxID=65129 RepID=A0A8S1RPE2_9CILI|nr:unnamed protein product [Paramecium sonneborni]